VEIYYRLAVYYFATHQNEEALTWLEKGFAADFDKVSIIESLFPAQWENPLLQQAIKKYTP